MIDFCYWPTPNGWKVFIMPEETGTEKGRKILFGQTAKPLIGPA